MYDHFRILKFTDTDCEIWEQKTSNWCQFKQKLNGVDYISQVTENWKWVRQLVTYFVTPLLIKRHVPSDEKEIVVVRQWKLHTPRDFDGILSRNFRIHVHHAVTLQWSLDNCCFACVFWYVLSAYMTAVIKFRLTRWEMQSYSMSTSRPFL
jgi:hypothetical protein